MIELEETSSDKAKVLLNSVVNKFIKSNSKSKITMFYPVFYVKSNNEHGISCNTYSSLEDFNNIMGSDYTAIRFVTEYPELIMEGEDAF
jgi:hypothetical protein